MHRRIQRTRVSLSRSDSRLLVANRCGQRHQTTSLPGAAPEICEPVNGVSRLHKQRTGGEKIAKSALFVLELEIQNDIHAALEARNAARLRLRAVLLRVQLVVGVGIEAAE